MPTPMLNIDWAVADNLICIQPSRFLCLSVLLSLSELPYWCVFGSLGSRAVGTALKIYNGRTCAQRLAFAWHPVGTRWWAGLGTIPALSRDETTPL